jgi:hypothetical protein
LNFSYFYYNFYFFLETHHYYPFQLFFLCTADGIIRFEYAGHVYELSSYTATWAQAQTDAAARTYRGMPGHLVTFMGDMEGPAVAAFFKASSFWIAASDAAKEKTWLWTAGPEAGMPAQMLWAPKEPNGDTGENCGEMIRSSNKFHDLSCAKKLLFVIEYECDLSVSIDGCTGMIATMRNTAYPFLLRDESMLSFFNTFMLWVCLRTPAVLYSC